MVTVYLFIWTTPKSEDRAGANLAGPNFPGSNDSGPKTDRSYCEHHWVQIFDPLLYELILPDAVTEFSIVIFQGKGMTFWGMERSTMQGPGSIFRGPHTLMPFDIDLQNLA